jgi:hypothetical protein
MNLKPARQAQYEQYAEFTFTMADAMLDVNGVLLGFKTASGVFEPIPLPNGAIVTNGDITVETVSNDSGTATIAVGDSVSAARYLAATSIKAAARTPLVPTGYRGNGENIRITFANAGANATLGTVSIRVAYIIANRMHEVVIV